ncbi:MAG TPA: branched-chain amino acid ABC transporter permease [Streptosporangiaceae bacterium]|nr:branched-chain amino acid ABC transporter permease [Streptosporangiaceae bacterium]
MAPRRTREAAARAPAAPPRAAAPGTGVAVTRWSRPATVTVAASVVGVAVLAALPYLAGTGVTQALVTLFLLVSMAVLWNLLAGYAGMISFGQQAYLGIGAYIVWLVSKTGMSPFLGIVAGAGFCVVAAVPIFALLRPLSGGYFAVATWVVAECLFLYVTNQLWLGGGTGVSLSGQLSAMPPVLRNAYTYWLALALMAAVVAGVYLLVRSRFGLDSRATRDEPAAAATMGVEVQRTRWLAYLLAALGFGAVGGVLIVSTLYIDPATVFSVNYSADMLFMVVIGGIGTMEGPVIGAVVFFFVQEEFAGYGAWYLVAIGAVAIVVVLTAPGGLWGQTAARRGWSLLPVGYRVRAPGGGSPGPPGAPSGPDGAPGPGDGAPVGGDGDG